MAAVSDAQLSDLGQKWSLPTGRSVRVPRSVAGRLGAAALEARSLSFTSSALGLAAVRRGRRPTLVASADGAWHSDAVLRRSPVAAVFGGALRCANGRSIAARRGRPLPGSAAAAARRGRGLRFAVHIVAKRVDLRTWHSRD